MDFTTPPSSPRGSRTNAVPADCSPEEELANARNALWEATKEFRKKPASQNYTPVLKAYRRIDAASAKL